MGKEFYLSHSDFETRKYIAKFRMSDHFLDIERGRYRKVPRELRRCTFCNQNSIDDECHFFLYCNHNQTYRNKLLADFNIDNVNHTNTSDHENLIKILSPTDFRQIQSLVSFIKRSSELRIGVS